MPIHISKRANEIQPSASIAAKKRVTELQAQGREILDFTIGEPDLDTPPHIVEAAVAAMREGQTHYTATAGVPRLRELIARKASADSGIDYDAGQVVVGSGAKQLIYEAFAATLDPGDEVIVPAPYWTSYPDIARLSGGVPVVVPTSPGDGFKLTAQALEAAIGPRTRWLIVNSPSNPTGAVYDTAELRALAEVLERHPHVMVMTDDIYEHLVYDGVRHVNFAAAAPGLAERILLVNGFSKSYAMTGWRVGYAVGPAALVATIVKLIGQSTTCVSSISQAGAIAALEGDQSVLERTRLLYQERRDLIHRLIAATPGFEAQAPQGAFYLFPGVSGLIGRRTPQGAELGSDTDVVMYLLEAANVAVMDGASYGASPYLRLSYATSLDIIERGCRQIAQACARLV